MGDQSTQTFDVRVTGAEGEWDEAYSDKDRYIADDLFLHYVTSFFSTEIRQNNFTAFDIVVYLTIASLIAITGLLNVNDIWAFLPEASWIGVLERIVTFDGLNVRFFDSAFVPTIFISLVALFVYEHLRIRTIAREAKKLAKQVLFAKADQDFFIQLYPGGGTLRFSYGKNGLFIDGGNLHSRIDWHSFDPEGISLNRIITHITKRSLFRRPARRLDVEWNVSIESSTHLLLFLKPDFREKTPYLECLVIPRSGFFDSGRNCTDWRDFCNGIARYLGVTLTSSG